MAQTYTYSISVDFPNGKVAPDVLTDQINDSSISTGVLQYINVAISAADNCDIVFDVALSAGDVTTLDGLVAAHDGEPYLDIQSGEPGWNLRVEDRNLTAPPGSPTVGLYWIVAAGATGAWAGHDDCIAGWNGTTWQYQRPTFGLAAWIFDEDIVVVYVDDTTKWDPYGTGGGSSVFGFFVPRQTDDGDADPCRRDLSVGSLLRMERRHSFRRLRLSDPTRRGAVGGSPF
jgi:hypothetical protein